MTMSKEKIGKLVAKNVNRLVDVRLECRKKVVSFIWAERPELMKLRLEDSALSDVLTSKIMSFASTVLNRKESLNRKRVSIRVIRPESRHWVDRPISTTTVSNIVPGGEKSTITVF